MMISPDSLVVALASLPSIKFVELWVFAEGKLGNLQSDTLETLLRQSSSLQTLHVEGFTLTGNHIDAMATALRNNQQLVKLDLHIIKQAHLATVVLSLARSLKCNSTL